MSAAAGRWRRPRACPSNPLPHPGFSSRTAHRGEALAAHERGRSKREARNASPQEKEMFAGITNEARECALSTQPAWGPPMPAPRHQERGFPQEKEMFAGITNEARECPLSTQSAWGLPMPAPRHHHQAQRRTTTNTRTAGRAGTPHAPIGALTKRAKFVRAAIVALALAMLGAMPAMAQTSGVPGKPTGLMATAVNSGQIDLSWTAPTDVGDSAITMIRTRVVKRWKRALAVVFSGSRRRAGHDPFGRIRPLKHYATLSRLCKKQQRPRAALRYRKCNNARRYDTTQGNP